MIYCVEDEKNIRELLIYTLETTGFSARGMANSKELKDALKEELPDLILLESRCIPVYTPEFSGTASSCKYTDDSNRPRRNEIS